MTDLIKAHYVANKKSYIVIADRFNCNLNTIAFKFDTGASNTMISLAALIPKNSDLYMKIDKISVSIEANKNCRKFTSASGDGIAGVPCIAYNVNLAGYRLEKFYFWLTSNSKYKKALIGDDFISCCRFSHEIGKDIIIDGFSEPMYKSKHNSVNSVFQIDSISTCSMFDVESESNVWSNASHLSDMDIF